MGKLHETLAVEGALGTTARRILTEAKQTFMRKHALFDGAITEVEPGEDNVDGVVDLVPEKVVGLVQETVPSKIAWVCDHLGSYWNAIAQKECSNAQAKASVEIDGKAIVENVPPTFLLPMEKQLTELRDLIGAAPTADGAVEWTDTEWDHVRSSPRERRVITKKKQRIEPVHEPTEHQPGTHVVFSEDIPIGIKWITKLDGRTTSAEKARLLGRVDELIRAVRRARSRANDSETVAVKHGTALLDWIFATGSD